MVNTDFKFEDFKFEDFKFEDFKFEDFKFEDFKFEEHNFTTEFPIKVGLIVTMVELRFSNPVV